MVAPVEERPQVILLLPVPLTYQTSAEGSTMAPSTTPKSLHAKTASEKPKSEPKAVATLKVTSETKVEQPPPARPVLPQAKPPFIEAAPRAKPTKADDRSLQSAKPPPFLPPPPPVLELDEQGNMTYRYSRHHIHTHKSEKDPQPRAARVINIPPPPPGFPGFPPEAKPVEQCTLTIYHVCCICIRPRSEKYHLEHPIPASGVPPPPGICRRCRIKSVDHKDDHAEVVHVEESDKVRVGISAFLPKDSLYTQEEANDAIKKQHQKGYAERFIREDSSDEDGSEQVVYRYIERTRKSGPVPPVNERAEVSAENLAAMNLMNDQYSVRSEKIKTSLEANDKSRMEGNPATRYYAEEIRVAEVTRAEGSQSSAPPSVPARSLKSRPPTVNTKGPSTRAPVSVKTSVAGSQSNVQATAQVTGPDTPGFTESEIRIFARDEVERYRQAERMVHAHPNAFTHGRLVPVSAVTVERRIDVVSDEAAPKPWEETSLPPPRLVFSTRRSEKSAVSKDEPTYIDLTRGEGSRHSYRVADHVTSGTKSTSSESSPTRTKEQPPAKVGHCSESRRYEHDVEVLVERGRMPPMPSLPPQQIPESDAPGSVKLKEVVGMIREKPMHSRQPSVRSEVRHDLNTIEVIEEIELPPTRSHVQSASIRSTDPVVSQRVKILRAEPDPQRHQRTKHAAPKEREEASVRTDKSYWEADGTVRSASGYSSMRQGFRTETKAGSEQPSSHAEQDTVVKETVFLAVPSPRPDLPKLSSHGRSDDAEWYASRVKSVKKHQQRPDNLSYANQQAKENDDDKTVWPADDQPVRAAASERPSLREPASERPSLREDWDWEYKRRVLTAIDHPNGDNERARERQVTERTFRRRRPSTTQTEEVRNEPPARNNNRAQESQLPPVPPSPKFSIRSRIEKGPTEDRGRGPYMHNSEESAHVRFASKIEFSPTPPRSNESLPEPEKVVQSKPSSQTSKGGQHKKSALRNQIDGGASEPPESAEDLISIYEANRSLRGRSVEKIEDVEYVSAKFASSAKEGSALPGPEAAAAASARSEPRSYHNQPSRHAVFEREDNLPRETEERHWRSSRRDDVVRRSSPSGGGDTETATKLSRERRLVRALSESPSRENMRMRVQRQQEQEAEVVRGRQDWRGQEEDGKGPYREEARTESMDVLYGSHGGSQEKEREFVVRERW
jgi:hypothetical protein